MYKVERILTSYQMRANVFFEINDVLKNLCSDSECDGVEFVLDAGNYYVILMEPIRLSVCIEYEDLIEYVVETEEAGLSTKDKVIRFIENTVLERMKEQANLF